MMKKALVVLLSLMIIFGTCFMPVYAAPPAGNKTVSVTGVTLNTNTLNLNVGQGQTLTATISPKNATNKTVFWSTSNEAVATVDEKGYVTAIAAGSASITVKTEDRGFTATCVVNVVALPPASVKVTGVTLDVSSFEIIAGNKRTLVATVTPDNATNKEIDWISSNSSVAIVNSNGEVTAIAEGNTIITVKTRDGSFTAECSVTVKGPEPIIVPVKGVTLDVATLTLEAGKNQTLTASITPNEATNKEVIWSSSNTAIASVNSTGLVATIIAVEAGTAEISVTTVDGNHKATCTVTVMAPPPPPTTIHYVALGDSIATGTTSRGTTSSYVNGFYAHLKTKFPEQTVTMTNLSKDGDASWDLLSKLSDPTFNDEVKKASIITISIGGNNILNAGKNFFSSIDHTIAENGTKRFEADYDLIIDKIRKLNGEAKIIVMTLYNPYNSKSINGYTSDPKLHTEVQPYITRINNKITGISDNNYVVADVYSHFLTYAINGKMGDITYFYPSSLLKFTRDPHPNQTGQNLIVSIHKGALP